MLKEKKEGLKGELRVDWTFFRQRDFCKYDTRASLQKLKPFRKQWGKNEANSFAPM